MGRCWKRRHRHFYVRGEEVTNENYFTIRVDHKFSGKDNLSGTYMRDNSKTVHPGTFDELLTNVVSARQVATIQEQHIFSPAFLNSARVGFKPRRRNCGRNLQSFQSPDVRSVPTRSSPAHLLGPSRMCPD